MAGPGPSATWRIEKITGRHRRLVAEALDGARRRLIEERLPPGLSDAEAERAFLAWNDASGRARPLALVWLDSPAQAVGLDWLAEPPWWMKELGSPGEIRTREGRPGWSVSWNPWARQGLLSLARQVGRGIAPSVAPETILRSRELLQTLREALGIPDLGRYDGQTWRRPDWEDAELRPLWDSYHGREPFEEQVTRTRLRRAWLALQPPRIRLQISRLEGRAARGLMAPAERREVFGDAVIDCLMRETLTGDEFAAHLAVPDDEPPPVCGAVHRLGSVVLSVARPVEAHLDELGRAHCETGPAEVYRDGFVRWCLQGVEVDAETVLRPHALTADRILAEENVEAQRVMVERFGWERLLAESCAVELDDDPRFGTLFLVPRIDGREQMRVVRLTNSTAEPDGTFRRYMLRVPPTTGTAREAVAWTFGMDAEEYDPRLET